MLINTFGLFTSSIPSHVTSQTLKPAPRTRCTAKQASLLHMLSCPSSPVSACSSVFINLAVAAERWQGVRIWASCGWSIPCWQALLPKQLSPRLEGQQQGCPHAAPKMLSPSHLHPYSRHLQRRAAQHLCGPCHPATLLGPWCSWQRLQGHK